MHSWEGVCHFKAKLMGRWRLLLTGLRNHRFLTETPTKCSDSQQGACVPGAQNKGPEHNFSGNPLGTMLLAHPRPAEKPNPIFVVMSSPFTRIPGLPLRGSP